MKRTLCCCVVLAFGFAILPSSSDGALITFDAAISGATSFLFDGDGDSINDVIFTTTDPTGFNTVGPGTNMSFINEPGLEGTTTLAPDLRVDFNNGAVTSLSFGFAVLASGLITNALTFSVFDSGDVLLATTTVDANHTSTPLGTSDFPENQVSLSFSGIASYATFDFNNAQASRYILDNVNGTFGSTEAAKIASVLAPEPSSLTLLGIGCVALLGYRWRKQRTNNFS